MLGLTCSQCGKPVAAGDKGYSRCGSCGTVLFLAEDGLVPYARLRPQVYLPEAASLARRFVSDAGREGGVDGVAELGDGRAYDHLYWGFAIADGGMVRLYLTPATPTPLPELRQVVLPSGVLSAMVVLADVGEEILTPSISLDRARNEIGAEVGEGQLVRLPLYEFPYTVNGRAYRVVVEGVTGQCLASRVPRRSAAAWILVLAATTAIFGLEGYVLWGSGPWLLAAYVATAVPAGILTYYKMRATPPD
ncbi:MAG: hypothetical protein FJX76_01010 [Armatimonadetes bacterium]|nr:hypothetical protein [Armatimonadota bacterium]